MMRLVLGCCVAALCYLCLSELYQRLAATPLALPQELLAHAEQLGGEHRWAEAKLIAEFVIQHPELGDTARARTIADEANYNLDSFWGTARRFAAGALSGEPQDTAGMIGSLSLDLFVIGDIRDLAVQSWKEIRNGEGDEFIMVLSTIGLATTLAPQIDWAPALLKAFRRVGALSADFARGLQTMGRQALKTGKFDRFALTLTDFEKSARHLGPGPLAGVMRHVDTADDLTRIARASAIDAKGTYMIGTLFGNPGIKRISRNGRNIKKLLGSLKIATRSIKLGDKFIHSIGTPWLIVVAIAAGLWALLLLRGRRRLWHPLRPPPQAP